MPVQICPTCNRKIMPVKTKLDKRIVQDIEKASNALHILGSSLADSQFYNIRAAILSEITRLTRAQTNYKLLWNIYRRSAKGTPYYL